MQFFVLLSRDSVGTYHKTAADVNPKARFAEQRSVRSDFLFWEGKETEVKLDCREIFSLIELKLSLALVGKEKPYGECKSRIANCKT